MCFPPGAGAHFHKQCKNIRKKYANKHQKSNFLKQITEIAKMNCKSWLQNGLKSKKCPKPSREQHFYWFLLAEEGPTEGDWKGQCIQKWLKTNIFESILLSIVFQKCACGGSGEHIFVKIWKQNASEHKFHRTHHINCIFDASSHQDPSRIVFLHFAWRVPSEMKITKTRWMHVCGRPGGMRRGAGGRFEGG